MNIPEPVNKKSVVFLLSFVIGTGLFVFKFAD